MLTLVHGMHKVAALRSMLRSDEENTVFVRLGEFVQQNAREFLNRVMDKEARVACLHRVGKTTFFIVDDILPLRQRYRDGMRDIRRDRLADGNVRHHATCMGRACYIRHGACEKRRRSVAGRWGTPGSIIFAHLPIDGKAYGAVLAGGGYLCGGQLRRPG